MLNGSSDSRPAITDVCSVEDVERWYWTRSELVNIGRRIWVRTTGTKMELLNRIISTLSGDPKLRSDYVSRKSSKAKLGPPFDVHTCIPTGQTFNRELRRWIEAQTGASVRVNQEMRDLMKDPQGRTLGDLLAMVPAPVNEMSIVRSVNSAGWVVHVKRLPGYACCDDESIR